MFLITVLCIIAAGIFCICVERAMADVPHNDSENRSVEQVVQYHRRVEPFPSSVKYISWSDVTILANGLYKVTVTFRCVNRFHRQLIKKQIVLLNESGKIIKVMDCR